MKKLLFLAMTALCVLACSNNNPDNPNGPDDSNEPNDSIIPAKVTTGDTADVTTSSATLQGSFGVDITDYSSVEFGFVLSDNADAVNRHEGQFYKADVAMGSNFKVQVQDLSPDTKYYYCAYLLLNSIQYEFGSIQTFQTQAIPGIVKAAFSVAEGKQVYFSQGNLQYQASTDTWSFAEHQYDMIGTDNVTGGTVESDPTWGYTKEGESLADKIDLFGWGTGNNPTNASTDETDYATFTDWGVNPISNGGNKANRWRTLTYEEWEYLLEKRPDAKNKYGVAHVCGVNGLIFLPDDWTLPSGCSFTAGVATNYGPEYYATVNSYTASDWAEMESAGALFLPVAGWRGGALVRNVGSRGYYWSATRYAGDAAYYLGFYSGNAYMSYENRIIGLSVRLVYDLP